MKIAFKHVQLLFLIGGPLLSFLIATLFGLSAASAFFFALGWFMGLLGSAYVGEERTSVLLPAWGILLLQCVVLSLVWILGASSIHLPIHFIVPLLVGYVLAFFSGLYITKLARKRNPA
jgi:hypothetical protein